MEYINIFYLEQFVTICDCGTLSSASKVLNMTQPNLSRTISTLESILDQPLFEREKNRLILNSNGKKLYRHAKKILNDEELMFNDIMSSKESFSSITIGSVSPSWSNGLAYKYSMLIPNLKTFIKTVDDKNLSKELINYHIDVAISDKCIINSKIYCKEIKLKNYAFNVSKNHRLANRKALSYEDVDGEDILLLGKTGFTRKRLKERIPHSNFVTIDDLDQYIRIANNSDFICFTSGYLNSNNSNRIDIPICYKDDDDLNMASMYLSTRKTDVNKFISLLDIK